MTNSLLSKLHYAPGSKKRVKRIGRGQGSGHGGTATKGHKGQHSRSGAKFRPWFEGGQMPLVRRVPKFGFNNPFRVEYQVVNVGTLQAMSENGKLNENIVTPELLYQIGIISKKNEPVKILGNGILKTKLEIHTHAVSESAKQKIESAGGSVHILKFSDSKGLRVHD